jgi:hypothetical protein
MNSTLTGSLLHLTMHLQIKVKLLTTLLIMLASLRIAGQDTITFPERYLSGISVGYGTGSYSESDRYISGRVYDGSMPILSIGWKIRNNRYFYRLMTEYRQSDRIHNYNVSTDITQFSISQGFLYLLKKGSLLSKDLFIRMGPESEIFVLTNKPGIAVSGFDYAQSAAGLLSLVYSVEALYPLGNNLDVESALRFSILSLGFRSVDNEETDEPVVKPLTLLSGINSSINLGVNYYLFRPISIQVAYRFEYLRISSWEMLQSISNNFIISTCYNF